MIKKTEDIKDDIIVDEIDISIKKKKKKINGKAKGNRGELEIVKILNEHFNDEFARVGVTSGARIKNTRLPKDSIEFYCGDIITPKKFRYSIECKTGYSDVSLTQLNKTIDSFIVQAEEDASISGKEPCILFKQNRKPWLCLIKDEIKKCQTYIKYRDYFIYDLKEVLNKKTNWYIEEATNGQ